MHILKHISKALEGRQEKGEWDAHDGGLPSAVGPQQGSDLVPVEGQGQVPDPRLVAIMLLGHRQQDNARGASFQLSFPILQGWACEENAVHAEMISKVSKTMFTGNNAAATSGLNSSFVKLMKQFQNLSLPKSRGTSYDG